MGYRKDRYCWSLFSISVNGIVDRIEHPIMKSLYVDDAAIFAHGIDLEEVRINVQTAIDKMVANAERIGFSFSAGKTRAVHFCILRREHDPPRLRIGDEALVYADRSRFVGMTFDEKRRWQPHIIQGHQPLEISVQLQVGVQTERY